ncbi:glutamine-synthetase adenylyltransferase [Tranquillimonas alkanivorans]|uniref:Glutamate-ammonia-ligase adenylyltransferase n=1 Tax=Tranquillimonas alkanivorans TaxID=441119 RepID=A0A1I5MK99_9RHOB|nr:glutamine-synthetase adenylyltransferase [Tranquillimonas alkanivorans]SFP09943.1 glutamate-ammonia-ligase adenylyltransferase [Tranquillimonas alkanivorans]
MTFASRLTRSPDPFDRDRGEEGAAAVPGLPPELAGLLRGTAGCAPYLKTLIEREAEWLAEALAGEPEDALAGVMDTAAGLEDKAVPEGLRTAKRRVALLAALADLGGVWTLEEVTGALARFADLAVNKALATALAEQVGRGKIPDLGAGDVPENCGMTVLAMGKMGAFELNYSSDIDLICLFDQDRFAPDDYLDVRTGFIRATRKMAATLTETGPGGYVFRTDLRLRPDPSTTPVCLAMEAAERYYESLGRTWERAAHVKARPCAGDIAAGEAYLERLRPFVWRRHLDFWAIQDAHDMRLRIRSHKGLGGPLVLEGHDMKLGRGGIREIEFFTQTRQIIAGGRDESLRVRGTVEALARLAGSGWVPEEVTRQLTDDYRAHREIEHRLQMVNDQQTHLLPKDDEGFERLAAFTGQSVGDLRAGLAERLERVADLTEDFFAPGTGNVSPESTPELTESQAEIVARWPSYPALRSQRAQTIFERLKPVLLEKLQKATQPDKALLHLDGFLHGLPAGVQVFSLFEANPQLVDLVIDVADTAPDLARYLSRNAGVFEAVIGGDFFAEWPGEAALTRELVERMKAAEDYEEKLDAARAWAKDWHFRIGVHHLRGLIDGAESGAQYADLAGAVLEAVHPVVVADFAERHGPPPGRGAAVLGMGAMGARKLNACSDLDLIVIYDAGDAESSEGRRPLGVRPYYARLTQALVTALSAPMAQGKLYEVDMRLRPSGRQGPVATSLQSFRNYQENEAWTWEHLALTRARPVAGSAELCDEIERFRGQVLTAPRDRDRVLSDTAEMRERLLAAKPGGAPWEAKQGPGRLQDIELAASALALLAGAPVRDPAEQLAAGRGEGLVSEEDAATLTAAHALLWEVHAATRLITREALKNDQMGAGAAAFLTRNAEAESPEALSGKMDDTAARAAETVARVLGVNGA